MSIEIKERLFDYGPQRASWQFQRPARVIRDAVSRKLTHHTARRSHWKDELAKAEKELKGSIQIREHAVTGGVQHTTVFDQEKSTYVTLCKSKLAEHEAAIEEFDAWWGLLSNVSDNHQLVCTLADSRFFGLGDNPLSGTPERARS